MEEPELRVGGWEKQRKRGIIRRLFYFLLIVIVTFLIGGPELVDYRAAEVTNSSLYYSAGIWNGPFEETQIKEFNGHLKVSSSTYENTDGESATLTIVSIRSFLDLNQLPISVSNMIIEKVESQAQKEGLELGNGYISREKYDGLPADTVTLQWSAEKDKTPLDSKGFFNDLDDEEKVEVRAFYWSKSVTTAEYFDYQTIICILFGIDQDSINEGINLIENVR